MSRLFSPIRLRGLTMSNRVVVAPMCQYSAQDGLATDWHLQHYGALAASGPGMIVIEATGVTFDGRISPNCLALADDATEQALTALVRRVKGFGPTAMAIQLGHAGRKASAARPWDGHGPAAAGGWPTVAPSVLPFDDGWPAPEALDRAGLDRILMAFVDAAMRAHRAGFDAIELHSAHGYLLHQFLSPLANQRTDSYGGSLENRMRFPLQVVAAVREVWPDHKPVGIRISATDWLDGGLTVDESVIYAREFAGMGIDYVCVSSGGVVPKAPIPVGPGYQVHLAETIRQATGLPTRAVGLIVDPHQAETILDDGKADMIALARAFLDDPRWVWHAAAALGEKLDYVPQYARAAAGLWPGAAMLRMPAPGEGQI